MAERSDSQERGPTSTAAAAGRPKAFVVTVAEPRYAVELTMEGWQIKDNMKDRILIDQYASKAHAVQQCETLNRFERIDAGEGQGRR